MMENATTPSAKPLRMSFLELTQGTAAGLGVVGAVSTAFTAADAIADNETILTFPSTYTEPSGPKTDYNSDLFKTNYSDIAAPALFTLGALAVFKAASHFLKNMAKKSSQTAGPSKPVEPFRVFS